MKIRLLTITHKTPSWIKEGYEEYVKRLPSFCTLELIEIAAEKRSRKVNLNVVMEQEGKKILTAIQPHHHVIALDVKGDLWTTEQVSEHLNGWLKLGKNIDLLVGGPEGLSPACLAVANEKWSLSRLTFPHLFIRVIIAEQIYRAFCILQKHPYHR